MKVTLVSESDSSGGAAKAAFRLYRGLKNEASLECDMVVGDKEKTDSGIIKAASGVNFLSPAIRNKISRLPVYLYPKRKRSIFSPQYFGAFDMGILSAVQDADVVNLHWICNGFMSLDAIAKIKKPVIWTLHDIWAMTGGCHYAGDCDRFTRECGRCPILGSKSEQDLSTAIFLKKKKILNQLNVTLVAPSRWIKDQAKKSALCGDIKIEVIPGGLDLSVYFPKEKQHCKKNLGLDQEKKTILFGAIDFTNEPRKGFDLFKEALKIFFNEEKNKSTTQVVLFGDNYNLEDMGLSGLESVRFFSFGKVDDEEKLSEIYSASDVMVAPSREEVLGQTVMEAMACGTPCVTFAIGGFLDVIENMEHGYMAKPYDVADLAKGIDWVLEDKQRRQSLSLECQKKVVEEYSVQKQVERYKTLIHEVSQC